MKIGAGSNVANVKSENSSNIKSSAELKKSDKSEDKKLDNLFADLESSISAQQSDTSRSIRG